MNRSTNIKSRVYRNLLKLGFKNSDVVDEEIYDQIQQAQDNIIADAFPDMKVTIAIEDGVTDYLLSSDTTDPKVRRNVASVKVIEIPSSWTSTIDDYGNTNLLGGDIFPIVSNKDFADYKNNSNLGDGQPRVGTIVDGTLIMYPTPDDTVDGDELTLYCYKSSSAGSIDKDTVPEISEFFDKAMELYATSQFLVSKERAQWLLEFEEEMKKKRPIQNRKHHNFQRPKPVGW